MSASAGRWPTKRLRFLTSRGPSIPQRVPDTVTFLPMDAISERGGLDLTQVRPLEEVQSGYSRFCEGDVVVAKITPCFENGKGALIQGIISGVGFGTTELHVLTPGPDLDGRFLYYVTMDPRFRGYGQASMTGAAGQQRVPEDFLRDFRVPLLPLVEQSAIADFLDSETAQIDALVAAKERLLEVLAEKRRALITHAVTRGLDPRAPLRNSGIPWLGEIPAPWATKRAKWLFQERDERSAFGEEVLLSLRMDRGLVPHNDVSDKPTRPEELVGYKKVATGQIVINRMRAASGLISMAGQDGLVSPDYAVFVPEIGFLPDYFLHLFTTGLLQTVFRSESTGLGTGSSGFLRLYSESFLALWFPFPPLEEQHAIVAHIAAETAKLDALRAATERSIALLKERRSALIAAAVTGQFQLC